MFVSHVSDTVAVLSEPAKVTVSAPAHSERLPSMMIGCVILDTSVIWVVCSRTVINTLSESVCPKVSVTVSVALYAPGSVYVCETMAPVASI